MSIDNMEQQESLSGIFLNALIVQIDFPETQKYGEAVVRIPEIHGDATQTPDADLPAALFYQKAFPASFGSFDVGDSVLVSFMNGDRNAPIIEGKVFDLEKVAAVIPEYSENYGKIKGMFSSTANCCFFFDENSKSVIIRHTGGAVVTVSKDSVTINASTVTINSQTATIQSDTASIKTSGSASIDVGGECSVKSGGVLSLSAPMIREN